MTNESFTQWRDIMSKATENAKIVNEDIVAMLALVARQFVEMSRARIEGLIATFPKLLAEGKQHTFIETDAVRYVYQPLEELYVLLITTKASNILEDLETLRLFARVIPEYASGTTASDVMRNAFDLIFAFDEIVALGYREDVSLAQIHTYTEMDSHEERVFRAIQKTKERDAKEQLKQRAKELAMERMNAAKRDGKSYSGIGNSTSSSASRGNFTSSSTSSSLPTAVELPPDDVSSTYTQAKSQKSRRGGGMQLGGGGGLALSNKGGLDQFVNQLQAEGETVMSASDSTIKPGHRSGGGNQPQSAVVKKDLHFRIDEKLTARVSGDETVESLELAGIMHAQANSPACQTAEFKVDVKRALGGSDLPSAQLQTHPNIDKKAFQTSSVLKIKQGGKPFPLGQEVGILRWRLQTQDKTVLPLTINCWPNPIPGGFEVSIEYELQQTTSKMQLNNVVISIPLPPGSEAPCMGNYDDGSYDYDSRKSRLNWVLPLIDSADNATGSMEFTLNTKKCSTAASADSFFPVDVSFDATQSLYDIKVVTASSTQQEGSGGEDIPFSCQVSFTVEKYEII